MTALHSALVGSELHYSKIQVITGAPGSTPSYVGQSQFDKSNGNFYVAQNTNSSADWLSVTGTGGINSFLEISTTTYTVLTTSNGGSIGLTNVAARTITLPGSPINGFEITVFDLAGTANTANITINGTFPEGSSYVIKSNYGGVTLVYDLGNTTWVPKSISVGQQLFVKSVNATSGNDLVLQTTDTQNVKINVNSVNALDISTTNFEIKKTLYIDDVTDTTKKVAFAIATATTGTTTILNFAQTAGRILTFPDITDTLVSKNSTDIFTNKSFNNTTSILGANELRFNNSGNTFYTSLKAGANAANLAMTLPTVAPSAGQALYSTDTSGTLSWVTISIAAPMTIQIFTSGSGTYNLPTSPVPLYIRVRMVGGGGGGGGGGATGSTGTSGTNSTFGTLLLTAHGGGGGDGGASGLGTAGGVGGIASYTSGTGVIISGAYGDVGVPIENGGGGGGGSSFYGGAGASCGDTATFTAQNASTNSGSGGGGGSDSNSISRPGCGGGAGGYLDVILTSPLSSYSYSVGTAGSGGAGGSGGDNGGNGGSGLIVVEEYY